MPDVNLFAVLAATVVAFVLSGIYYPILSGPLAAVSEAAASDVGMPPWMVAAELGRNLLVATVVTGLAHYADVDGLRSGLLLALALWIGFPSCCGAERCCTRTRRETWPPSTPATGC